MNKCFLIVFLLGKALLLGELKDAPLQQGFPIPDKLIGEAYNAAVRNELPYEINASFLYWQAEEQGLELFAVETPTSSLPIQVFHTRHLLYL